jgi:hypothetical protein
MENNRLDNILCELNANQLVEPLSMFTIKTAQFSPNCSFCYSCKSQGIHYPIANWAIIN